ncbi:MAG TPA: AraC family transcriptional regulator [Thermodesulfobacteriota bacterium]
MSEPSRVDGADAGRAVGQAALPIPDERADASPPTGGLPGSRLRRVTEYVEANLQRDLRLAELSGLVHMSPFHFARLFKASTGLPPHRFVVHRRIARAAALLTSTRLSVGTIARLVGFRTPSHFTTAFRRRIGVTPSAYRER